MKRKVIAIVLIMAQWTYLLPAQELGSDLLLGRQRLERYLDRAAMERSAEDWEAVAWAGLEAALLEWESVNLYWKETEPLEWEARRSEAAGIYGLEKEKAYVEWVGRRIYAERAWEEGSELGLELRRAAREWTYTRSDGSGTREIDIGEAGRAREAWELVAGEIIERYLAGWEERGLAAYSELWDRFSGNGISAGEREAIYRVVSEEYLENVKAEYRRIAEAERNDLMRALLYDGASLKKKKSEEAAGVIARQLAEEAKAATDKEIAKLFSELEVMISAGDKEGVQINSREWLESFRLAFERGLAEWDAAGEAFLTARAAWEQDAEQVYLGSEAAWVEAYFQLEERRGTWEKELVAKLEAGLEEWGKREESLTVELEAARQDFAAVLEERKENKRKLIEAQTGIYERSRELLEMARQGAEFWYEEWGGLYKEVEKKYKELFGSQGPPEGYIPGYIDEALRVPDFNSLTANGGEKIEELIKQLKLWKSVYLETIKKIYTQEIASYQTELAGLKEEIKTLQAQLGGVASSEYKKKQEINARIAANNKSIVQIENNIGGLSQGYEQLDQLCGVKAVEEISAKEILEALKDSRAFFNEKRPEAVAIVLGFDAKKWGSGEGLVDGKNGWLTLARGYRKEADDAVVAMYKSCGIDISGGVMSGYVNELGVELLKARAVLQYWQDEKEVAQAVDEYAQRYDSSRDSAGQTQAKLELAKRQYETAQDEYDEAIKDLEKAAKGIEGAAAVFREAEVKLNELNVKVRKAREEYLSVMAVIRGVSYDYINDTIIKIAAGMEGNEKELGKTYEAYMKALQAFAAVRYMDLLERETEVIRDGGSYWESAATLNEKIAVIEGAKKGGAAGILRTFAANQGIAGEGLRYERELLEELRQAYQKAAGGAKKELGKAIYAVWDTIGLYYKQELNEAQKAIAFVRGEVGLEEKGEAWKREMELRSWFTGQLAGIAAEMEGAEAFRRMTLDRQKGLLEELLAHEAGDAFLAAVNEKRDSIDLAEILRYGNAVRSIRGIAIAWAAYRKAGEELGLRAAEGDAKIAGIYGHKTAGAENAARGQAWDAIAQLKEEFERESGGIEYSGLSLEELAAYIQALRKAGAGLDMGGRAVLEEYILGMLEYVGIRDANNNQDINTAELEAAYEQAKSRYQTVSGWQGKLNDAAGYMSVLAELDKGGIAWLGGDERERLVRHGASLMLRELPAEVLWAARDFGAFKQTVREYPGAAGWVKGYMALSVELQQELYGQLMGLFRPGGADDEIITGLVAWHWLKQELTGNPVQEAALREWAQELNSLLGAWYRSSDCIKDYTEYNQLCERLKQLKAGEKPELWVLGRKAELEARFETPAYKEIYIRMETDDKYAQNHSAEWYAYYLAGDELLYIYLSSPAGFQYIPTAAEYLKDGERAEKLRTYCLIENRANRYIPLLDGDIAGWVEKQNDLTEAEKGMLKEYLTYGDYHRGIEYYRQEEESRMSGRNAVIEKRVQDGVFGIYLMLEELKDTEGLYEAEAKDQYAQYVKAEYKYQEKEPSDDYRTHTLPEWYLNETVAGKIELTDEQKAAIEYAMNYAEYGKRLERLAGKIARTAGLFGGEPWAGGYTEQEYEAAVEKMNTAGAKYQKALRDVDGLPVQMEQYLTLYDHAKLSAQKLEERKDALLGAQEEKEQAYNEYRWGEYQQGIQGIQDAYALYNGAAGEVNRRHVALNAARLIVRKQQEIYDWAESIYLSEKGAKSTGEYETPKEKVGRIEYAYERARISVKVLEDLASGSPLENKEYEKAMGAYREVTEKYYRGMVAQYDVEQAIMRQRQALEAAQMEEQAARGQLMRPQITDDELSSLLAYDLITLAYSPGKGSTVTLGSPSAIENYEEKFREYFTKPTEERRDPWKDWEGAEITPAEKETVEWLLHLNEKLKTDAEYYNDLMLAAMWRNYQEGGGDAKKVWYGGTLDEKEGGYTEGPLDPVNGNYSLRGIRNPDFEIDPIDFSEIYRSSRLAQMEAAYNKITQTTEGKEDLAWYLLYRNSTLAYSGEKYEKPALVVRAIQAVINKAESRRGFFSDMERNALIAAGVSSALALLGFGVTAVSAALIVAGIAKTNKDFYQGIKTTALAIQTGEAGQKGSKDLIADLERWNKLYEKMKGEEVKLNRMVYGRTDAAGAAAPLKYNEFIEDLELFYTGGLPALKLEDARKLYSEALFNDSKAGAIGSVKGAIGVMNGYLREIQQKADGGLAKQATELKDAQLAARKEYEKYVQGEQEIKASDRQELARLAAQASDIRLSVGEREAAGNAYDELLERLLPAGGIRDELDRLAQKAWGSGTWNSHANDMELVGLAAEQYDDRVRYERGVEGYTQWAAEGVKAAILAAVANQNRLEMEVEEARLELIAADFVKQRDAWTAQAREIQAQGPREWEKAKEKINEGYNRWRREFKEEYAAKTTEWEANYVQFTLEKQEWVEAQYLQAANAGNARVLEQAGADVTEVIGRALEGTKVEQMNRGTFEAGAYIDDLLEGTALAELMAYGGNLADRGRYGAQAVRRGNGRETAIKDLQKAKETQETQNEEMTKGAARLAASQARKLMEEAIRAYEKRLEAENAGMQEWEEQLVRSEGYTVDKSGISRRAVVDATLWDLEWKTQWVHRYEYFRTTGPQVSINLDGESLSAETVMALIGQGYKELEGWGDRVFGKAKAKAKSAENVQDEATEDDEEARGELGKHIGKQSKLKEVPDVRAGREANIVEKGSGQLAAILLDFQWNMAEEGNGWAEAAKPAYDKKLWNDDGFIEPLTMRSAVDLVVQIGSVIVGSVLEAVGNMFTGVGGTLLRMGIQYLMNTTDDLLFAVLDSTVTSKREQAGEVWADFGKKAAINGVSAAASYGIGQLATSTAAAVTTAATKAAATGAVKWGASAAGQAVIKGTVTAVGNYATTVATSSLQAWDWTNGGFDMDVFTKGVGINGIAGALGAGVTAGMNSYLPTTLSSDASRKYLNGAMNLGAGMAGELTKYSAYTMNSLGAGKGWDSFRQGFDDMGGLTLNVANIGALIDCVMTATARSNDGTTSEFGAKFAKSLQDSRGQLGMFEVNLGVNGVTGRFGSGGIDLGGNLYDLGKRGIDYTRMMGITDQQKRETVMQNYGWGDWVAENTSMRIESGLDKLVFAGDVPYNGYTERSGNGKGRTITIKDSGDVNQNAVYLQHEAYRSGYKNNLVNELKMAATAHTEMANRMRADKSLGFQDTVNTAMDSFFYQMALSKGDMSIWENYVMGVYDSTDSYWKLTNDGRLINDNIGWLTYADTGLHVLNSNKEWIGAEGTETGLLNIIFGGTSGVAYSEYQDWQIEFVQDLMTSAGMSYTEGKDGVMRSRSWGGNETGQVLNMAQIMFYQGETVAAPVFARYYDDNTNSDIARILGKDIGSVTTNVIPLSVEDRYSDLLNAKISFYNNRGSFVNDSLGYYVSTEFGEKVIINGVERYQIYNNQHFGEDIAHGEGTAGDPIYAGISGKVTYYNRNKPNNGKNITLEYGYNFEGTFIGSGIYGDYYHMKEDSPYKKGSIVAPNTEIGMVGKTGVASAAHLHYDMFTIGGGYYSESTLRMFVGTSYMDNSNTLNSITSTASYWDIKEMGGKQKQENTRTVYKPSLYYQNSLGYDMPRPTK
jgi:murein DD-endopeptidase MepM/ murein hydrolase activator NlpD